MGQRKSVVCMLYSFYTDSEEVWNVLRLQFHSLLKVTFKQDRFIYYLWKMCRLTAIRPIRFTFRGEVPAPSCSHHLDSTIYDSGRVTPKILSVKKFFRCHVFWLFYVFIQKKKKKGCFTYMGNVANDIRLHNWPQPVPGRMSQKLLNIWEVFPAQAHVGHSQGEKSSF